MANAAERAPGSRGSRLSAATNLVVTAQNKWVGDTTEMLVLYIVPLSLTSA